ncbi:hypothetical protein [Yoonia sp. BS5-3]|uniref:Uncharacterized protein n=1 Tax=Yoonia phaeophyticola TaxID=3137369 RepID=A0ABZ2V8B6_9RHOB
MKLQILLLSAVAAPAIAECPAAGDLSGGIRAYTDDGGYEDYQSLRDGVVEINVVYDDGYTGRMLLAQGTYILDAVDTENGKPVADTRLTYAYPVNAQDMPIPQADARWSGRINLRDLDGVFQESQSHRWGPVTRATFGACSYDTIVGKIDYKGDGYSFQEEIQYLPELGIGLLTGYTDAAEGIDDVYTYISIEKLQN